MSKGKDPKRPEETVRMFIERRQRRVLRGKGVSFPPEEVHTGPEVWADIRSQIRAVCWASAAECNAVQRPRRTNVKLQR